MLKRSALLLSVLSIAFALFTSSAYAQTNGYAGIQVNASGELRMNTVRDNSLKSIALQARKALGSAANETSEMRCVSLRALEKAIEANNYALTDEMKYLAGLTRIEYVFFDPESKDVIIAGPAENWVVYPELDRVVGIQSGRPVVRLEDLVAALERAALVTEEKVAGSVRSHVKLDFSDGTLKISANSSIGSTYDELETVQQGGNICIAFNNRYLIESLRSCDSEKVKISLSSPLTSINIEPVEPDEKENDLFMLLPVRMKDQ